MLELAASVFYHSSDGIMIADLDGNILSVNRSFTSITGYAQQEVLGCNARLLKSGRHGREFYLAMWDAIPVHEVDDACRHAGIGKAFDDFGHCCRGLLRRLEDT
jgi:PAS domain S-box-containing protein